MRSLLYALIVGVIGAVLLHIIVILAIPVYSGLDAYARVLDLGPAGEFYLLPEKPEKAGVSASGPFVKEAACAISIEDGPVLVTANVSATLWTLAVFDSGSNEVFSMSDRTSTDGSPTVVAGTEAQIAELKKADLEAAAKNILVVVPDDQAYAVLRAVSPFPSTDPAALAFLKSAACDPLDER